ncbi:MAG: hypothetical protein HC914_04075 [Chloroflexaceae bacterium]|nr:hypothetical protein [Chloroflexaceae bacterium]
MHSTLPPRVQRHFRGLEFALRKLQEEFDTLTPEEQALVLQELAAAGEHHLATLRHLIAAHTRPVTADE